MSELTLHGRILLLDDDCTFLAVLTSEEMDEHGNVLHSEALPFMATDPLHKGTIILERRVSEIDAATLASVELFAPLAEDDFHWRAERQRVANVSDTDDAPVGLDELVEAFLIPSFDSFADHDYWQRFVGLTCAVFGLEHHAWEIELARDRIVSAVVPLQRALEVPEPFGRAFERHRSRIQQLTDDVQALQRAFLRDVLLAMDPELEHRSTTIGRLRQLGLPKRRSYGPDDL